MNFFVSNDKKSQKVLEKAINLALIQLKENFWNLEKPYTRTNVEKLKINYEGESLNKIIKDIGAVIKGSVNYSKAKTLGYMHGNPTIASIVAELIISATNQSLDAWEESPSATYIERGVINEIKTKFGYNEGDGIIDSGGTMSNTSAIIIARDKYLENKFGINVKKEGIGNKKLKIFCTNETHFSIDRALHLAGLGTDSIIRVPVNDELAMDHLQLKRYIQESKEKGELPFMVVATAGSTNAGNIPNIRIIGEIAQKHKIWYHVDAAFGGALAFSEKYKNLLDGIENSDSITFDPHKQLYQSISCGIFLLKESSNFRFLRHNAEYINPKDENEINLISKSLQTTKRFDALKLYMSLRHLGLEGYDKSITTTIDNAQYFAQLINQDNEMELSFRPHTNIILFRFKGSDKLNEYTQKQFYKEGKAIIGKTKINGTTYLKATCMNPLTSKEDYEHILFTMKNNLYK